MTGNKNKQDMSQTANEVKGTRAAMEAFRPEFAKQREAIGGFRKKIQDWGAAPRTDTAASRDALGRSTGDVGAARGFYTGMLNDPSKRGYGEETVNQMKAKQLGAAQGAATDLRRGLTKATAAAGMGSTGAAMRNVMTANEKLSSDLLGANRDVDLAQAQASREDLWGAAKGIGETGAAERDIASGYGNLQGLEDRFNAGVIGAEGQTYEQQQQALNAETGLFNAETATYNPQIAALEQKNRPGFWGNFGNSFANSFGRYLGGGG